MKLLKYLILSLVVSFLNAAIFAEDEDSEINEPVAISQESTDDVPSINDESTQIKGHSVGDIVLSQTYPIEEVQKAVCKAATRREWTIMESTPERVVIYLAHRKYESTLTFLLTDSNIKIYSDSYKIKKLKRKGLSTSSIDTPETERIKKEDPKGWIDNLKKDIPIYLDRIHSGLG